MTIRVHERLSHREEKAHSIAGIAVGLHCRKARYNEVHLGER